MFNVDPKVIAEAAARKDRVYPYAVWAPIPESQTQAAIKPRALILHSMAGPRLTSLEALRAYVARDDIHIEPTFAGPDFDGRMFQLVYVDQRADCNAKANSFAVSCETQDNGSSALPSTPWSAAQVEQLAGLAAFLHLRDGVKLAEAVTWDGGGIGGHARFPEWSIYVGKTCPGAARFAQIPQVIARAKEIVAAATKPPSVPSPVEDDVNPILWRDERFNDTYQVFPTVSPLDPKLAAELRKRGAVDLVGRHRRQLRSLAMMCGQTSVTQTDGKIVAVADIPDVGN